MYSKFLSIAVTSAVEYVTFRTRTVQAITTEMGMTSEGSAQQSCLALDSNCSLFVTGLAEKTVEINGVTIPKGMTVQLPIHLIHHNPDQTWNMWPRTCMAVASGRADRVLARPRFRWSSVHVRAWRRNPKTPAHHRANFSDKKVTFRQDFQPSLRFLWHVHAGKFIRGIWNHSIASFPRPRPAFPSFAVRSASEGKLGGSLGTRLFYSFGTQCESKSFSSMISTKKRSPSKFFCCEGMPSICSCYVH